MWFHWMALGDSQLVGGLVQGPKTTSLTGLVPWWVWLEGWAQLGLSLQHSSLRSQISSMAAQGSPETQVKAASLLLI